MGLFTKVEFETQHSRVTAGHSLKGILHMELKREIKVDCVDAFFCGEEKLQVYHRVGERVRTYHDKERIIKLKINCAKVNNEISSGVLPPGSYQVPFQMDLPSKLPASCEFGDCNDSAKVEYVLQAKLTGSGFVEDYHAREVIQVEAAPKLVHKVPYHVPPQCDVILGGQFFVRGLVATTAEVEDTLLIPGQQMKLDIAIVNDSLASVHKIRAELRETAEWTVNEHTRHSTNVILEQSWDANNDNNNNNNEESNSSLIARRTSHLDKKGKSPFSSNPFKKMPDNFDPNQYYKQVEEQLKTNDDHLLSLTLPPLPKRAQNSYTGAHMKVTHQLKISLVTHMLNSDPEFNTPIRVARGYYS